MKKIICGFVKHEELKCTDNNERFEASYAGGIFYDETMSDSMPLTVHSVSFD